MIKATNWFNKIIAVIVFALTAVALAGAFFVVNERATLLLNKAGEKSCTVTTTIAIIAGAIALVALFVFMFKKLDGFSNRQLTITAGVLFAVYAFITLIIICNIQSYPNTDSYIVQDQAITMAKGETNIISNKLQYFSQYNNNNLFVLILAVYFRIVMFFGVSNFYLASMLLNAACIVLAQVLIFFAVNRMLGLKFADKFLLLSVLHPLLYLNIPWVYTATFSLPLMSAVLYLGSLIYLQKNKVMFVIQSCLFALLTVVGYYIRPVVVIVAIAVMICMAVGFIVKKYQWRRVVAASLCAVFVAGSMFLGIKTVLKHYYPDDSTNFPMTHWIMMGLHEDGQGNAKDLNFTRSFNTKEERNEAAIKEIKKTLSEYGVAGMAKHLTLKQMVMWSDGSGEYMIRARTCASYNGVYDYLAGGKFELTILYCQIFRAALLMLLLLACIKQFKIKKINYMFLPMLIIFGGMLFYLVWEAKESYCVPFMSIILIFAAFGVDIKDDKLAKIDFSKIVSWAMLPATFAIILAFILGFNTLAVQKHTFRDASVQTNNEQDLRNTHDFQTLNQSFYASKNFNKIELRIRGFKGDAKYTVNLLKNGELISTKIIGKKNRRNNFVHLTFKEIKNDKKEKYNLIITKNNNSEESLGFCYNFSRNSSLYEGSLTIDGNSVPNDLKINVYRQYSGTFMPSYAYVIMAIAVIALCAFLYINSSGVLKKYGDHLFHG